MASRFGYPNYRLSELSLVPVNSDNPRSTGLHFFARTFNINHWNEESQNICKDLVKSATFRHLDTENRICTCVHDDETLVQTSEHTTRLHCRVNRRNVNYIAGGRTENRNDELDRLT